MSEDRFASLAQGLTGPATRAAAVTPSETGELPFVGRAIQTASDGFLDLEMSDGGRVRVWCLAGLAYPLRVGRLFAAGTTASGIVVFD